MTNAFFNRSRPQGVTREGSVEGVDSIMLSSGGFPVVDAYFPKSIHLAYSGSDYQVEVCDPSLAHTRQLVPSGQIEPVD